MDLKEYDRCQFLVDFKKVFPTYRRRRLQFVFLDNLPAEEARVFFLACFFWRALASQLIYGSGSYALREIHHDFEARADCRNIHCHIRKPADWLLTQAEQELSPTFISALTACLKPAMELMVDCCKKILAYEVFHDFRCVAEGLLRGWESERTPLLKNTYQALMERMNAEKESVASSPVELAGLRQPVPDWLQQLPCSLSSELFTERLKDIVGDALVYPGAGHDWSPLRQMDGILHSYIYCDTTQFDAIMNTLTMFRGSARLFPHHAEAHLVGQCEINLDSCMSAAQRTRIVRRLKLELIEHQRYGGIQNEPNDYHHLEPRFHHGPFPSGRAVWAVYDLGWRQRVSLLYLDQEAIIGLAWLRLLTRRSPKGFVLQDHGLGGNFWWQTFGQPYHQFLMQKLRMTAPEWLIAGHDGYGFVENTGLNYRPLCLDDSRESMWGNGRTVYRLQPGGEWS